jgi:hypothetical protein
MAGTRQNMFLESPEQQAGFPPIRIWYGQFVYWKACPCPVRMKPKTAKCPYIPKKNLLSVPIVRIFCLKP